MCACAFVFHIYVCLQFMDLLRCLWFLSTHSSLKATKQKSLYTNEWANQQQYHHRNRHHPKTWIMIQWSVIYANFQSNYWSTSRCTPFCPWLFRAQVTHWQILESIGRNCVSLRLVNDLKIDVPMDSKRICSKSNHALWWIKRAIH